MDIILNSMSESFLARGVMRSTPDFLHNMSRFASNVCSDLFDKTLWLASAFQEWRGAKVEKYYTKWRIYRLSKMGLRIGNNINLPRSVWIDTAHCHLITIEDNCGFGDGCCILAHDALGNEFLDATRVARVHIGRSCHIGAKSIILPGVKIGPRTIIGAGSVVSSSLPPDTIAAGNPARVISSLDEYLSKHRARIEHSPRFAYSDISSEIATSKDWGAKSEGLGRSGYVLGGYSAARKQSR